MPAIRKSQTWFPAAGLRRIRSAYRIYALREEAQVDEHMVLPIVSMVRIHPSKKVYLVLCGLFSVICEKRMVKAVNGERIQ